MSRIISIVGRRHSGKTIVLEGLIAELTRRGLRVGVLKHTSHEIDIDREGKDTWRYRRAGAHAAGIMSPRGVAVIRALDDELPLDEAVALLGADLYLILTEGFKRAPTMKIEIVRAETGCELLTPPEQLLAVVTNCRLETSAPQLAFEDSAALADIVLRFAGTEGRP